MALGWGSLPLLPLRNVLQLLSLEDALSAMSTSRHWRDGLLMYEGRRETLSLHAKQLERSAFLARMFKKHVRVLVINVAACSHSELSAFMSRVMTQFFDTLKLQEVLFIGPGCVQQTVHVNAKLDRIITESLLFKHSHSIHTFAMMNCQMDTHYKNKEKDTLGNIEFHSRGLRFDEPSLADAVLSRHNAEAMMFSSLQHIIVDYNQITTETLETLSHLTSFTQLSAILCHKMVPRSVDWGRAMSYYPNGLDVALNLISLSPKKIDEVIDTVLVAELPLTSLKVMFCKTLHLGLLRQAARLYRRSLRELLWADAPLDAARAPAPPAPQFDDCDVNPIILICWQCTQLRRLVIHGYWMLQYDVIGCVRLCKALAALELSAVGGARAGLARLRTAPRAAPHDDRFVRQVNEYTEFKWQPTPWHELHPALRARAPAAARSDYVVRETRAPLALASHFQN